MILKIALVGWEIKKIAGGQILSTGSVCVCVCVYIYIYIYIYTHTHYHT